MSVKAKLNQIKVIKWGSDRFEPIVMHKGVPCTLTLLELEDLLIEALVKLGKADASCINVYPKLTKRQKEKLRKLIAN